MNTIQRDLDAWDGIGYPPSRATIRQQPAYQALSPADKITALNTAQRMAANRIRTDDPEGYGDTIRDVETDFQQTRQEEIENHLAADLAAGKFTGEQVADYTAGRVSLMDYPEQPDLAGPWVTHKLPVAGGDGKPAGYAYVRHDPRLSEEALNAGIVRSADPRQPAAAWNADSGINDRVEVAWSLDGKGERLAGVDDIPVGERAAMIMRGRDLLSGYAARQAAPDSGLQEFGPPTPPDEIVNRVGAYDATPGPLRPAMAAAMAFADMARLRPEIADRIGQGFWKGLPGEAAKGFLSMGAAGYHGFVEGAFFGNRDAVKNWQQGQADIDADIEGQSRLAFRGALSDKVLRGISSEAVPMVFSMGAGAVGAAARKALTSAVGKTFLSRMAALEMEQAARQGLNLTAENAAKVIAGELTGEGVGATMRQGLASSLARGYMGKWLGTAEIEGALARQLADRVSNAVAFLPSSARGALDNMATTLNKAAELRAAGKEAEAAAMEDTAVLNGWAGLGIETLSENIWLNEFMVTRAGRSLARVSNDVLERTLRPGLMTKLAARGKAFLKTAAVQGNQEGVEEIAAGISGRAWMNEFAAQNQDLLAEVKQEYLTGAALGALLSGAKALAADGQPAAFRELVTRGIDGDAGALASLARIRAKAEAISADQTFAATREPGGEAPTGVGPASPPAPAAGAAVTRLANLAGNVPPPIVSGDATEAPAGDMDPVLVPPAPADLPISPGGAVAAPDPTVTDATTTNLEEVETTVNNTDPMVAVPAAAPEGNLFPMPEPTAEDSSAVPVSVGTAENPPVPDAPATIMEQARLAADPASTRAAVLVTPGSQRPGKIPGLVAFQGDSPHGLVLYNPRKITPAQVRKAAQAPVFDGRILGFSRSPVSGAPVITGTMAVTVDLPGAPNVHAELIPDNDPAARAAAIAAAQKAVPGGTVTVKPATEVLATRAKSVDAPTAAPTVPTTRGAPSNRPGPNDPAEGSEAGQSAAGEPGTTAPSPAPDRPAAAAKTREAAAMARAQKAAKGKGRSWFRIPPNNTGSADVLDFMLQNKAKRPPKMQRDRLGKVISRGGENDPLVELRRDKGVAYYTAVTSENGRPIDLLAGDAYDAKFINEPTVRALMAGLLDAISARHRAREAQSRQDKLMAQEEAKALASGKRQDAAWNKATASGPLALKPQYLAIGELVDVEGELLEVTNIVYGQDGMPAEIELTDGDRFGTQVVAGEDVIHVEDVKPPVQASLVQSDSATSNDLPPKVQAFPVQGNPEAERVAFGNTELDPFRGDMFAGTDEDPFNLTAESAEERRAREARELKDEQARAARAAEEARRKAEADQGTLFSRGGSQQPGVSDKFAADARAVLRSNAPELLRGVRFVRNPADLNPDDYHPDDWATITDGNTEAFYRFATRETIVILDNVTPRPGETQIGAVSRVILHERLAHAGLDLLRQSDPEFRKAWAALSDLIPAEELAALLPLYPHLAEQPDRLAEEWFARRAEAARIAPPGSLLGRIWAALKAALQRIWRGLRPGPLSLDERVAEMLRMSRKALRQTDPTAAAPAGEAEIMASRMWPGERRDWANGYIPTWLSTKLGATAPAPYKVQAQTARAIITGSKLPGAFAKIVAQTQDEIRAVNERGATLSRDLQAAMTAYAQRSGQTAQQVADTVNAAMEDPAIMASLTDTVLRTRAIAARNFVDALSAEIAATTGGTLASTIRNNAGHWLRRGYAVFDAAAGWNGDTIRDAAAKGKQLAGRDARAILASARSYLQATYPALTPAGIEAMISDLTNRDAWQAGALGIPRPDGLRVSREVSSFMARKDIPAPIRALMGEERNPIARLSRSIGIQAQLIARYDQQRAMRDLGLRMGIFRTTADGTYHKPVGGSDVNGNMRWNGFAITDPATGKTTPVYTTPEMLAAMDGAAVPDGRDLGGMVLRAYKALGAEAKMNKVALNPDSWAVNIMGNVIGMVQSGDALHWAGWQRVAEAWRLHRSAGAHSGEAVNAVAEAIRDTQRALVGRMAAAGVAGASFDMQDLLASLDNSVLAFIEGNPVANRAAGAARGAVVGQSLGRAFGPGIGQAIGGAAGAVAGAVAGGKAISGVQKAIARAVLSTPDNIGKIAVFLGNYASHLAAGDTDAVAFQRAAEKTRNTMPDYSKLPALLREASKLGMLGSFIAFQHEVYRNYYWNVKYAIQELRSGNGALVGRGLRRMLGAATVTALGGGLLSVIAGAVGAGADDDRDQAYRRSLGAPWERFAELAYTHMDGKSAIFFNTSYLVPQTTLFEIYRAASEGKDFGEAMGNALSAARRQFAGGSVHADPVLEALMNTRMAGGPVTYEEGAAGWLERAAHVIKVALEPGATGKAERIGHALRGEEIRGRKFSLQEEALRMIGVRQSSYQHSDRIRNRLYEFRDTLQNARAQAKKLWKDTPQPADRQSAIDRANERIAAAEAEFQQFRADMKTIGIPGSRLDSIRKDVGLSPDFHRLKAGKAGPETIKQP